MKFIAFTGILLIAAGGAFAQNQAGSQTLNIGQAVQMGVANSKQLKLDTLKLAQVEAKQAQVSDAALPNVSLNAGYSRLSPIDPVTFQFPGSPEPVTLFPVILNNYTTRASVSEGIFTGWRLKYTEESYGFINKAAQLDVTKDEQEVRLNIMSAYISYVKLTLSQHIVEENLKTAQQRVDEVTSMKERGLATDNDVLKAQLYQSNLELSKSDVDNSIAVAQFNLCILLGLPEGTTINADTTGLFAAVNLLPETQYEQDAVTNRSELKSAGYRVQSSQSNVKLAQASYYPTVGVGADYYFARPNQRIIPYVDEFRATWDVGVNVSWNISSLYTGKHNVQEAQVQLMQTQVQSDMLTDNIKMEVFQNYMACQGAITKMSMLQLAVTQAEENYRQTKARYDQQLSLMSEVLDADAALLQARINLVLQQADVQLSYDKLLKSTGTLK
ncbi:MAG TPA: TolC family protein [Bacteroidia bacterium]|nr:TolC family protein [Bacteroidia bacterium]